MCSCGKPGLRKAFRCSHSRNSPVWTIPGSTGWNEALYGAPNPVHLARVAEALEIDPARIDEVSADHLAASLPSVRTYFRSKTKATPEQLDAIEAVLREIHHQPSKTGTSGDDDRTGVAR